MHEERSPGVIESEDLTQKIERAWALADRASSLSALDYLKHVVINSTPPEPFRKVAEPWQWALAGRIIPAIEHMAHVRRDYKGPRKFWFTLPKGHDKTTFIGRLLNWAMAYSRTSLRLYATAKDKDQAGLIADAMQTEMYLNPWLSKRLEFKNWKVHGANNSKLEILATDAAGSQGIRGDGVVVDEISQWTNSLFFTNMLSGIDKRERCVLFVITNAGVMKTWQWEALLEAKRSMAVDGKWYVYEAPGRLAKWMNADDIAQTRRMMPSAIARMLFDNVWINPGEDTGYVTREQAAACVDPNLRCPSLNEWPNERLGEFDYVAAIDYGPVKDRTVCALCHREGENVVVDRMDVFQGSKERHVPIADVERWIDRVKDHYRLDRVVFDRYQMESTIQRYSGVVPVEVFEPRGSSGNHAMAENLRVLIINGKLRIPPKCGAMAVTDRLGRSFEQDFVDELADVSIRVTPSGYRIDNRLPGSHDDRVVAAGMSALYLMRSPVKRDVWFNDLWF